MLKDLVIRNRSTRGFDRSRKVEHSELVEMVDCARLSASSMSVQPLKFYIAESEEDAALVTQNVKFAGAHPEWGLPLEGTEPPAYILICQDLRIRSDKMRFLKDVGIYAQSMSLAAVDMGLNCLMIGAFDPAKLREAMGLPEHYEVLLALAVGKSLETIETKDAAAVAPPMYEGAFDPEDSMWKEYRKEDLQNVEYYRENGVHYAPKRRLEDVIISC